MPCGQKANEYKDDRRTTADRGDPLALYTQALYGVALVVTTAREAAELALYAMDAL